MLSTFLNLLSAILQTQSTTVTFAVPASVIQELYAVGVAVVYGLYNFLSNTPKEQFNAKMFLKTVVVSVAVGFVEFYMGVDPTTGYQQTLLFVTGNAVFMGWIDDFINGKWKLSGAPAVPSIVKQG